jgi:hypothetical protein
MKIYSLTSFTLSALPVLAAARSIHVDVSNDGEIAVDVTGVNSNEFSLHRTGEERHFKGQNTRKLPNGFKNRELGEHQVDLGYEIHQGLILVNEKFTVLGIV